MKSKLSAGGLAQFMEDLQAKGRITFSSAEAIEAIGISRVALVHSAERLMKKKHLIHPSRGFYVITPAEHKTTGSPPASWFIDALMKFHEQPYYVGGLSAAALHGAAHQSPQEFQVITHPALRPIRAGRSRIRFLTKKWVYKTPIQQIRTPFGDIPVSTPEATAFDLVQYVRRTGGLSNVTTILIELAEKFDPKKLATAAEAFGEVAVAQRVGYLLDTFADSKVTTDLNAWVKEQRPNYTTLRPNWKSTLPQGLQKNDKWRLIRNEAVEPDV